MHFIKTQLCNIVKFYSGCITSAESVLIGQQNHTEFLKLCKEIQLSSESRVYDKIVVGLSSQPILSFANKFQVSPIEARAKLSGIFPSCKCLKTHY